MTAADSSGIYGSGVLAVRSQDNPIDLNMQGNDSGHNQP
jgi:hypothetical protein